MGEEFYKSKNISKAIYISCSQESTDLRRHANSSEGKVMSRKDKEVCDETLNLDKLTIAIGTGSTETGCRTSRPRRCAAYTELLRIFREDNRQHSRAGGQGRVLYPRGHGHPHHREEETTLYDGRNGASILVVRKDRINELVEMESEYLDERTASITLRRTRGRSLEKIGLIAESDIFFSFKQGQARPYCRTPSSQQLYGAMPFRSSWASHRRDHRLIGRFRTPFHHGPAHPPTHNRNGSGSALREDHMFYLPRDTAVQTSRKG